MIEKMPNKLNEIKSRPGGILYPAVVIIFLAFTFQSSPPSGWYQQNLPHINNRPISDMTFTDSLTGYIVTPYNANDTAYILKTINGGDNWSVVFKGPTNVIGGFNRIQFINQITGYACGNFLWKTTNMGINWFNINTSGIFPENMHVLNQDTIWIIDANSLVGGVFRTTNGGASWQLQYSAGSSNARHIYMYNSRIGFTDAGGMMKTTNGGVNWFNIVPPQTLFFDIYFIDSLRGWKCNQGFQKTTDGGLTWQEVPIPPKGGNIFLSRINKFHNINADTIFAVGSLGLVQSVARGLIYKTTNGGTTWGYQKIDTSINIFQYHHIQFTNKSNGWAYADGSGVHTVTGGDSNILLAVNQISSIVPDKFNLKQNYPNPFNPVTNIKFEIPKSGFVQLNVYDITGKIVQTIVNQKLSSGEYAVDLNGNNLTSGIYFYSFYNICAGCIKFF
jgi:hypothetical protein